MSGETNILVALSLLVQLAEQTQGLAKLIAQARSEGRDITEAELDSLAGDDDAARDRLRAAIDKAIAEGR